MIQRNFGFIKEEDAEADIREAHALGFWTGAGLATIILTAIFLGGIYAIGAFY